MPDRELARLMGGLHLTGSSQSSWVGRVWQGAGGARLPAWPDRRGTGWRCRLTGRRPTQPCTVHTVHSDVPPRRLLYINRESRLWRGSCQAPAPLRAPARRCVLCHSARRYHQPRSQDVVSETVGETVTSGNCGCVSNTAGLAMQMRYHAG